MAVIQRLIQPSGQPTLPPSRQRGNGITPTVTPITRPSSPHLIPRFFNENNPPPKLEEIKAPAPQVVEQPKPQEQGFLQKAGAVFQKGKEIAKGAIEEVQSLDFERIKTGFTSAVKATPGTLKIAGSVILDSLVQQQKFMDNFFNKGEIFGAKLPEPLKGATAIFDPLNMRMSARLMRPTYQPAEEAAKKIREEGQKERAEAVRPYAELGAAEGGLQTVVEAVVFNTPQIALSTGLTIATAFVTKNPYAAGVVGVSTSYGLGASEVYTEARDNGLSDKEALPLSEVGGMIIGAIDFLPLTRLIRKTGAAEPVKKSVVKKIASGIVSTGIQSGFEGLTEGAQEIVGNAVEQTYNENADLFEGVDLAVVVGAVFGGVTDVGVSGVNLITGKKESTGQVVENVNQKIEDALTTPASERTDTQKKLVDSILTQEFTPEEAGGLVLKNELDNTDLGREIMKSTVQANEEGKNIKLVTDQQTGDIKVELVDKTAIPEVIRQEIKTTETALTEEEKTKALEFIKEPTEGYRTELEQGAFEALKADPIRYRNDYLAREDVGGNEINPDKMRLMFEDKGYTGANANEFNRAVNAMTEMTYNHLLETKQGVGNNTTLVTAGSSGSGKSTFVTDLSDKSNYSIILDTTFSYNSAIKRVKQVIDNGFNVTIRYMLRDPLDAWTNGVLPRVKATGRIIDEAYHLDSFDKARENVLKAYDKYNSHEKVNFVFARNETGKGWTEIPVENVRDFSYNKQEVAQQMAEATERAYEQKQLTKEQYEAIKASRPESRVEEGGQRIGEKVVREPQPKTQERPTPGGVLKAVQKAQDFAKSIPIAKVSEITDSFFSKTPSDLGELWDNSYSFFQEQIETPSNERIDELEKQLKPLSSKRDKDSIAQKKKLREEIDAIRSNMDEAQGLLEEAQMEFNRKLALKAMQIAEKKGVELGELGDGLEGTSDIAQQFRDDFLTRIYERPYIETNWKDSLTQVLDEMVEEYGATVVEVSDEGKLVLKPTEAETEKEVAAEIQALGLPLTVLKFSTSKTSLEGHAGSGKQFAYQRPKIGKSEFKVFVQNSQEFKDNPVLTVNNDKDLVFDGERIHFRIVPDAMQLQAENLKEGGQIFVDASALKGKAQQMRVFRNGKVFASKGLFAELENLTQPKGELKVVEFPELVRLAKSLTGKTPLVRKLREGTHGLAKPATLDIKLDQRIFKDPLQAAKTLAHELGHIADFLPDQVTARGNLIGRIVTLNNFLRDNFSNVESETKIEALMEKRKPLQDQRRKLKDDEGKVPVKNKKQDLSLLKQIKDINAEIKKLQKTTIKNPEIRKELMDLSAKWRPMSEDAKGVASEIAGDEYRSSSSELYADSISVLFNDPVRLKTEAPKFWKAFFDHLNRKPEVKKNFFETWDLLNKGDESVFNVRDEELTKSFEKAEETYIAKELEKQKRQSSLWYQIKLLFDSKDTPIIEKQNRLRKAGKIIPPELNAEYALAGLRYSEGKLANFVEDNFQPIFKTAQEVEDGWNQFGKILFYERVIHERGELANPQGYSPETAAKQLEMMQKQFSREDWAKLQEAKGRFRKAVQLIVDMAAKNEYYTPELLEQMKMNPAYATYQVLDYLDTYISARVYHSVGTLKDIANPATATVMKLMSVHRAIERNNAKKLHIELYRQFDPQNIQEAKTRWNGRNLEIMDTRDPGEGLVIVIEQGKPKGYYIESNVAEMLNYLPNSTLQAAGRVARLVSGSKFYRPIFTGFNPGFQTFNFVRDFMRYWKNVPDYNLGQALTSFPRAMVRYAQAAPHARKYAVGVKDQMIREMQEANVLGLPFNAFHNTEIDPDTTQMERILGKMGFLDRKKRWYDPAVKMIEAIGSFGDFLEALPKVAGYIELKGQGKMSQPEMAHFIRTSLGSPDFRTYGTFTPITNSVFLYSNAIKEGIKSDALVLRGKSAGGRYSQTGHLWKTVVANLLPTAIIAAMAAGYFGKKLKEIVDKASEYDKSNYTIIPVGLDENGKAIYYRIPRDETGRLFGGMFWKILNATKGEKSTERLLRDLQDMFSFTAGQLPGITPSFEGISAIMTYLSGKNPYDSFRNRYVIPDTEFKAGAKESLPILLQWLANQQGAGIILPQYRLDEDATGLQKVLNLPFLSNVLGRWIKVSDYGETEALRKISEKEETERAKKTLDKRRAVEDAIEEYNKGDKSAQSKNEIEKRLVSDVVGKIKDSDDKRARTNLLKEFRIGIVKGTADPLTSALIYAQTNNEKVLLLEEAKKKMSDSEYKTYLRDMVKEGIISDNVLQELKKR